MTSDDHESPPPYGIPVPVPLVRDGVSSPLLMYGAKSLIPSVRHDWPRVTFAFRLQGDYTKTGRVLFEELDALRVSPGEYLPYETRPPHDSWVFEVRNSPWLRERHDFEFGHYGYPLLATHRHYLFSFHDEFVEAIAKGIWLERCKRKNLLRPPGPGHVLMPFADDVPGEPFTAGGETWELQRSPRPQEELIRDSLLCSQRLFQIGIRDEGVYHEAATVRLRTTDGELQSVLTPTAPLGFAKDHTYLPGVAGAEEVIGLWRERT